MLAYFNCPQLKSKTKCIDGKNSSNYKIQQYLCRLSNSYRNDLHTPRIYGIIDTRNLNDNNKLVNKNIH